jgi:hypothetical protein
LIWRYKIEVVSESPPEEHGAIIGRNADEGWELVTVYETETDWRFVFRRPDEHRMSCPKGTDPGVLG